MPAISRYMGSVPPLGSTDALYVKRGRHDWRDDKTGERPDRNEERRRRSGLKITGLQIVFDEAPMQAAELVIWTPMDRPEQAGKSYEVRRSLPMVFLDVVVGVGFGAD